MKSFISKGLRYKNIYEIFLKISLTQNAFLNGKKNYELSKLVQKYTLTVYLNFLKIKVQKYI